MDEGPFRVPSRSVGRRSSPRPEPASRQAEEPKPVGEAPKPAHHTAPRRHVAEDKKSWRQFVLPAVVLLVGLVIGAVGSFALSYLQGSGSAPVTIDSHKYQAVSFTDGQLYFGKLSVVDDKHLKLTDVYGLQQKPDSASDTDSDSDSTNLQKTPSSKVQELVKFTDSNPYGLYGLGDAIIISESQIRFYTNLKPDGKVAQLINKYKDSHK